MRGRALSFFVQLGTLVCLFFPLVFPVTAHANGRFPTAQDVLVGPGHAGTTLVLRTTFGLVVSDDSGMNFHWICEDPLEYAGSEYDPPVAIDAHGRIHVGVPDGLFRVSRDRCRFERIAGLDGQLVADLDESPDGRVLIAVTAPLVPSAPGRVYRSDDGGETFRLVGRELPDIALETVEIAPSDFRRVYFTGITHSTRRPVFFRSSDGGETLERLPLPVGDGVTGVFIAAVDPTDAQRVYVRVMLPAVLDDAGLRGPSPTALLRSDDGGSTWREIARTRGPMLGFAISEDGRTLWLGGPVQDDGLQRSDDRGEHWRSIGDVRVQCLRQHGGVLYLCVHHVVHGYALARSRDRGETIEPVLAFRDIRGPFACPGDSPENVQCGARWPAVRNALVPVSERSGGADAGARQEPSRGCGCRTVRTVTNVPWTLVGLAIVGLSARRRLATGRC